MSAELPKLITIVGTNASGKSMLGMDLAELFDGEVVSADSRQVYRELDIGTGKLAPCEMRGVPHHLINIVGLDTTFSLADCQHHTHAAIDDILFRGRIPFLVGGTGLYIRAIPRGYRLIDVVPNPSLREELGAQDSTTLWSQLTSVDPAAASLIARRNKRRVIRALELYADGQRYSEQNDSVSRYSALQLGLTWPTGVLRERIHARLVKELE
jgi:tRNA dimethylallyltransferase